MPPSDVPWPEFLAERASLLHAAQVASTAWTGGDPEPVAKLLGSWRFAARPSWVRCVMDALEARPPTPSPAHSRAALGDVGDVPPPEARRAARFLHRRHLFAACGPGSVSDPITWGLVCLVQAGEEVEQRERGAWSEHGRRSDAAADRAAAAMWSSFFGGDPWSVRETFEKTWVPVASRAFRAALMAQRVPDHARVDYLRDLKDTLFWYMIGGADGSPGWLEVAARLVETSGSSPVDALAAAASPAGWDRVARCPGARSRTWRDAARVAFPDLPSAGARLRRFRGDAEVEPAEAERLLDLTVALRLVARWGDPDVVRTSPEDNWNLVVRHRRRARGRLRAALMDADSEAIGRVVMGSDRLHARTAAAIRVYAWSRACRVVDARQLPNWEESLTAPCPAPLPESPGLGPELVPVLHTWLLLVTLRGRLDQLEHWARTGSWLRRPDSGWGRLLQEQLPAALRASGNGYGAVREELALELDEHLAALRAPLEALSQAGTADRAAKRRFKEELARHWHPDVPFPGRVEASFSHAVTAALVRLRSSSADELEDS